MNFKSFRFAVVFTSIAILILCSGTLSADMGMSGKRMEKMSKKLGLTKDQGEKMKALNEKGAETAKTLIAKMGDDLKRLKGLIKDQSSESVISAATSDVIAGYRRMTDAQMAHQNSMQAILTPTQYAKALVEMHEHRDSKGKRVGMSIGFGMGRGMGMGVGMGLGTGD